MSRSVAGKTRLKYGRVQQAGGNWEGDGVWMGCRHMKSEESWNGPEGVGWVRQQWEMLGDKQLKHWIVSIRRYSGIRHRGNFPFITCPRPSVPKPLITT